MTLQQHNSGSFATPPGFPTYAQFNAPAPAAEYDSVAEFPADASRDHRHQRQYSTLGSRINNGSGRDDYLPTRPATAPLPQPSESRRETSEQANLQLLISSMQELTAVVAQHGEEIRRLRDDARNYPACAAASMAASEQAAMAMGSFARIEARLAAIERTSFGDRSYDPAPSPPLGAAPPPWANGERLQRSLSTESNSHRANGAAIARPPSAPSFLSGKPLEQHVEQPDDWSISYSSRGDGSLSTASLDGLKNIHIDDSPRLFGLNNNNNNNYNNNYNNNNGHHTSLGDLSPRYSPP